MNATNLQNNLTPWDVQSRHIFTTDGPFYALYAGEGGGRGYVIYEAEQAVLAFAWSNSSKAGLSSDKTAPTIKANRNGEPAVVYFVEHNDKIPVTERMTDEVLEWQ